MNIVKINFNNFFFSTVSPILFGIIQDKIYPRGNQ
jgi:hypothetical protein